MIAFRQFDTGYREAESLADGIASGLANACAECGAWLADGPAELGAAAGAVFLYPGASPHLGPNRYACPACLACIPTLAGRLAASLDEDPT